MKRHSNFIVGAVATVATMVPTSVWAQAASDPDRYYYGPHMMGWGGGWYGMILGPILMIVVLAATIALAMLLVRWLAGPWQSTNPTETATSRHTPLDILKERFARGEIDKEEFEERCRVLGE